MKWTLKDKAKFDRLSKEMSESTECLALMKHPLITVGDYTSHKYREFALLQIYDGVTKRDQSYDWGASVPDGYLVDNPPGQVSYDAFDAVSFALSHYCSRSIRVTGEEDLLALPAILFAPDNCIVAWGDPVEERTRYVLTSPEVRYFTLRLMNDCGEWSE